MRPARSRAQPRLRSARPFSHPCANERSVAAPLIQSSPQTMYSNSTLVDSVHWAGHAGCRCTASARGLGFEHDNHTQLLAVFSIAAPYLTSVAKQALNMDYGGALSAVGRELLFVTNPVVVNGSVLVPEDQCYCAVRGGKETGRKCLLGGLGLNFACVSGLICRAGLSRVAQTVPKR